MIVDILSFLMARTKPIAMTDGQTRHPPQRQLVSMKIARKSAPVTTGVKKTSLDDHSDSESPDSYQAPESSSSSSVPPRPAEEAEPRRAERSIKIRPIKTRLANETSRYRGHISREMEKLIKIHLALANLHPSEMEIRFNRRTRTMNIKLKP